MGMIWTFVEVTETEVDEISLEVLGAAKGLTESADTEVVAVTFGESCGEIAETLASFGADRILFIEDVSSAQAPVERCEEALYQVSQQEDPDMILFGDSLFGRDLAARVAARLETGFVSDCVGLSMDEQGLLLQTKLTHGGKVATTFISPTSKPQMATLREGVFDKRKPSPSRKVKTVTYTLGPGQIESRATRLGFVKADPEKIGLDEADIIVSGGRGMGSAENFEVLHDLARVLGGVVGASLGAVDEKIAPRKSLVGQTGTAVSPKLYMACGISGSIYHVLGMKESQVIIAVNKDRSAPIFKVADMGVVGDATEVLPALLKRLKETSNHSSNQDGT
jgi:electron transfer flavoprotein alpha subunit